MQSLAGPAAYPRKGFSPVPRPRAGTWQLICTSRASGAGNTRAKKPNVIVSAFAVKSPVISSRSKYETCLLSCFFVLQWKSSSDLDAVVLIQQILEVDATVARDLLLALSPEDCYGCLIG